MDLIPKIRRQIEAIGNTALGRCGYQLARLEADAVDDDVWRFSPFLSSGGLMVLDDYSPDFPRCIQAVREFVLSDQGFESPVQFGGMLIVRRR